jgi:hypothetical protein
MFSGVRSHERKNGNFYPPPMSCGIHFHRFYKRSTEGTKPLVRKRSDSRMALGEKTKNILTWSVPTLFLYGDRTLRNNFVWVGDCSLKKVLARHNFFAIQFSILFEVLIVQIADLRYDPSGI